MSIFKKYAGFSAVMSSIKAVFVTLATGIVTANWEYFVKNPILLLGILFVVLLLFSILNNSYVLKFVINDSAFDLSSLHPINLILGSIFNFLRYIVYLLVIGLTIYIILKQTVTINFTFMNMFNPSLFTYILFYNLSLPIIFALGIVILILSFLDTYLKPSYYFLICGDYGEVSENFVDGLHFHDGSRVMNWIFYIALSMIFFFFFVIVFKYIGMLYLSKRVIYYATLFGFSFLILMINSFFTSYLLDK